MTVQMLTQIVDIALIVIFALVIIFTLISAIIGFKNGVFRTTHRMIIVIILFVIAACALTPMMHLVELIPLDWIPNMKTVIIEREFSGGNIVSYYAPVTNLRDTLVSALKGYYQLYGIAGSSSRATALALAMSGTVIKLITFFIDALLIVTLGGIFEIILWHALGKRLVPKLVRKTVKWPWFSMLQNCVVFLVSSFMLLAPISSIINAISNSYTKQDHEVDESNQVMLYVDGFINSYNNSLFAKTFVNWTVNQDGLSLDGQVMDLITKETFENVEFSVIDTVSSLADVATIFVDQIAFTGGSGGIPIDIGAVASAEVVTELFSALRKSDLLLAVLPVAAEMAMNEEVFGAFMQGFDPRVLTVSDIEWKNEIDNCETMILDIVHSGIIDQFVNRETDPITGELVPFSVSDFVSSCLTSTSFNKIEHVLKTIDNSKLLSRAVPAVIAWLAETNEEAGNFLPKSWDELNDISWGYELSTLLECVHDIYLTNPDLLEVILGTIAPDSSSTPVDTSDLLTMIISDIDSYKRIFIGETDANNKVINVDNNGRTIVYNNGKQIGGRKYCLLDLQIFKSLVGPILNMLMGSTTTPNPAPHGVNRSGDPSTDISERIVEVVRELNTGVWRKNYKEEFSAIFNTFSAFKSNPSVVAQMISGDGFMPASGDIRDIDPEIVKSFANALPTMDSSKLLSAVVFPLVEDVVLSSSTTSLLESLDIDTHLIEVGIEKAKNEKRFGYELSKLIRVVPYLATVNDCLEASTPAEVLNRIASHYVDIAYVLDAFHSCEIINPTRDERLVVDGNTVRVNANYYNILSYIFGSALASGSGLSFKENEISPTTNWESAKDINGEFLKDVYGRPIFTGENGNIANVLKIIGESNIISVIDDPTFFTDNSQISKLAYPVSEGGYDLPGILSAVNKSQVFSATMGDFLDTTMADMQIVGTADVSFNNVTDWNEEGKVLKEILINIGKAELSLNTLDLSNVQDVVSLNNMFHSLLDSSIFVRKTDGEFLFPQWLFAKFTSSGTGMTSLFGSYDLVADPDHSLVEEWNSSRGWSNYDGPYIAPPTGQENYIIFYNDLLSLNSKDDWSSPSFDDTEEARQMNNPARYGIEYWNSADFYDQYKEVMHKDELGRICELVFFARKAINAGSSPIDMDSDVFDHLVDTLNSTTALRIGVYNLYNIAQNAINNQPKVREYFDLSSAYTTYLVNCDYQSMKLYEESRAKRQVEIEYLKNVYKAYRTLVTRNILNPSTGTFSADGINPEVCELLRNTIQDVNRSLVFHRKGSALYDPSHPEVYYPTAFQSMLKAFLAKTDFKTIIYNEDNPKDVYFTQVTHDYDTNVESKVDYILKNNFAWRWDDPSVIESVQFENQLEEVGRIFDVINAIVGGKKPDGTNYHGLRRLDGEVTFSFTGFDIKNTDNVLAIKEILTTLNATKTLYDGVPNAVYLALKSSGISNQFSSLAKVKFSDANLFYHYFDVDPGLGIDYNWNAKFTDSTSVTGSNKSDIDLIASLMEQAALYSSNDPMIKNKSVITCFESIETANIQTLNDFMNDLLNSKVFHSSGPRKTIDSSGNVVGVVGSTKTVFQEVIEQFLSTADIAGIIINSNNPKDASKTLDQKVESIATTVFPYNASTLIYQEREVNYICNFLQSAQDFGTTNISNINLASGTLDADSLFGVLTALNDSACLYDCVPNILYKSFNSVSFSELGTVDFTKAEPFYHYTETGITDYNVRYSQSELDCLNEMVNGYQEMTSLIGNDNLTDLFVIKKLCDENTLEQILVNMHNSKMLHLCNSRNAADGNLTVFEDTMYFIIHSADLDSFIYGSSGQARMTANLETITTYEQTNPDLSTISGYHNEWVAANEFDELHAFLALIKQGQEFMGTSGSLSFSSMSFGSSDPVSVGNLMRAINNSDILSDALPVFIEQGFHDIGLDQLTELSGVVYGKYDLTQKEYGVAVNHNGVNLSEIDLIEGALENMYIREGNSGHYLGVDNIVTFAQQIDNFEGIMRFAQYGRILNTSLSGQYDVLNQISGTTNYVSARGILIQNILNNPSAGVGLGTFMTGANVQEKAMVMSKIFTFTNNYSYISEAKGVLALAKHAVVIDQNALTSGNFGDIVNIESHLDSLLEVCYNADGYNNRSYFASEIMSGVLDEIVATEMNKISGVSTPIYYGPQTVFAGGTNIVESTYAPLNKIEADGVHNSIEFYKMYEDIMIGIKPTRNEFISAMSKLDGCTISKVIYAAEINPQLPAIAQDTNQTIFSSSFSFTTKANVLATALGL